MMIQANKVSQRPSEKSTFASINSDLADQVGLVDGTGNNIATLASALYVLDQYFLTRDLDDKDNGTYPTGECYLDLHLHR